MIQVCFDGFIAAQGYSELTKSLSLCLYLHIVDTDYSASLVSETDLKGPLFQPLLYV